MINTGLHIISSISSLHLGGCPSWCGKRGCVKNSPIES